MTRSLSLSLIAAIVGAGVLSAAETAPTAGIEAPFWQLQGAAPAAHDTDTLAALRQAARQPAAEPIVVALRSR